MKRLRFFTLGLVFCWPVLLQAAERHVVLIVWDGMRPDFVSAEHTPNLWKLGEKGVTFAHHHASYLSATIVNGAAMATGRYPSHDGVIANYLYRPSIDLWHWIDAGNPAVIRKGDEVSGGKYLGAPTVTEILHRAGRRTAIAGTKYVALLEDRRANLAAENAAAQKSPVLFQGETARAGAERALTGELGPFPGIDDPRSDEWTTRALTDVMWKENVPAFSMLWLRDPDHMEHKTAPGSPECSAALARCDHHLGEVLAALERKGVRDTTDVFVVSDHGFSTIEHSIDLLARMQRAGFHVTNKLTRAQGKGDIMAVGNGGSVLFYVIGRDAEVTRRLVKWLQQTDFAGVIFSRVRLPGTFALDAAMISGLDAPDVILSFRWNEKSNRFGVPGMIDADWNRQAGEGTHATVGRFDMHNTLIASGPDFRSGLTNELPSGNIDLAPTILHLLEVKTTNPFDGRVLREALVGTTQNEKAGTETESAQCDLPAGHWQQHLRVSRVGTTTYLDEGNGALIR